MGLRFECGVGFGVWNWVLVFCVFVAWFAFFARVFYAWLVLLRGWFCCEVGLFLAWWGFVLRGKALCGAVGLSARTAREVPCNVLSARCLAPHLTRVGEGGQRAFSSALVGKS